MEINEKIKVSEFVDDCDIVTLCMCSVNCFDRRCLDASHCRLTLIAALSVVDFAKGVCDM